MSDRSIDEVARRLERLPREAWDRPAPPPAPWPPDQPWRARGRGFSLRLRPLPAALAATALVALGVAAGLLAGGEGGGGEAPPVAGRDAQVALAPVDGRGSGARGEVSLARAPGGSATVTVAGLRPSSGRDFYELWLLGADGRLVSLGSFRVPRSGAAEVRVPLPVDPRRFDFLDVSREPDDGDPAHSKVSVLRGPTV
jgi:anti-sigma-K factor RskA